MHEVEAKDGSRAVIRPARGADAAALHAIDLAVAHAGEGMVRLAAEVGPLTDDAAAAIDVWQAEERGLRLIAEREGRVVGELKVERHPLRMLAHGGWLAVSIHPEVQGLGLGRALVEAALEWARRSGVTRIELGVLASNLRAQRLYQSCGFVLEGVRRRFLRHPDGRWEDDLLMAWLDEPGDETP